MPHSKYMTPEVGMDFAEQRERFTQKPDKAGLLYALGDGYYNTIIHLNCSSVSSFNDLSIWAGRIYNVFCSDKRTYEILLENHRHADVRKKLLVSISQGGFDKSERKRHSVDVIYLNTLYFTSVTAYNELQDIFRNLLRRAKRLVVHTILAESLGRSETVSSREEWGSFGISRDNSVDPSFFPLSFYQSMAREFGREYVGVTAGEVCEFSGHRFDTHYVVFDPIS